MSRNLDLGDKRLHIQYNVLDNAFLKKVILKESLVTRDKILMICSMKWYKGVNEFVDLAHTLTFFKFRLVLNASEKEIASFFKARNLPENLEIFPVQTDVHPHFLWADLVLNLSRPDGWVETFGLTVLEAMAYHLPVIVPPIGGITELVENGKNGYKIDCRNPVSLSQTAVEILQNNELYESLQSHAALKVKNFTEENFVRQSLEILLPKSIA
jgi:glycosyltransferase involved in cell wall biosynthesis